MSLTMSSLTTLFSTTLAYPLLHVWVPGLPQPSPVAGCPPIRAQDPLLPVRSVSCPQLHFDCQVWPSHAVTNSFSMLHRPHVSLTRPETFLFFFFVLFSWLSHGKTSIRSCSRPLLTPCLVCLYAYNQQTRRGAAILDRSPAPHSVICLADAMKCQRIKSIITRRLQN